MPGTWARGQKCSAEDLDGWLELGKAGEKEEGKRANEKHPSFGKEQTLHCGRRQTNIDRGEGKVLLERTGRWDHTWRQEVEESPCKGALRACESK